MEGETKRKILIADDTPANIKVLGEALRNDYKISVATNGIDVLKIAESESPPDLILLDVMMPEMDGYETCKRLKINKVTCDIPIIFITAKSQEEDEAYGFELGAVDYITKPISIPILKARVNTQMELKCHRDNLRAMARVDGLTGIANRLGYDEYLQREWRRACRHSQMISLIAIDIDFFKQYNDCYGHQAGDDCIKRVALAIASMVRRPSDMISRYGGEEFVAILPDTDGPGAFFIANKMQKTVANLEIEHKHSTVSPYITISLGCYTMSPEPGDSADELFAKADQALYEAKNTGRNRAVDGLSIGK